MSELKRWKVNLDDDYGFHGLERSNGPVLEGMKEVSMGDCDLMLAHEVDAELTRLQEKVKQLEGDVTIWKDNYQTILNEFIANQAECERLRVDAARYQWLRENCYGGVPDGEDLYLVHAIRTDKDWREALDEAIDAHLAKEQPHEDQPK